MRRSPFEHPREHDGEGVNVTIGEDGVAEIGPAVILMNPELVIAIYAAIASTAAVGWEIFKWSQSRKLDVTVHLGWDREETRESGWVSQEEIPESEQRSDEPLDETQMGKLTDQKAWLAITIVNRSEHEIKVRGWGVYPLRGKSREFQYFEEMRPIRPKDSVTFRRSFDEIKPQPEKGGMLVAEADLTTGDAFHSEPVIWDGWLES